ncbi:hypothetical protein, partial [Candidatus Nitrosotalea sp. FS]|uniref:hypothetical protein n=1 Tax=Candidatus Nitrosotalea sp. FS TaxID=2341021 RepID=UPI0021020647
DCFIVMFSTGRDELHASTPVKISIAVIVIHPAAKCNVAFLGVVPMQKYNDLSYCVPVYSLESLLVLYVFHSHA